MQGTFCSRIFTNCDKKVCRLQSPNFPGIYPRNLTCYFAVRQVSVCGWDLLSVWKRAAGFIIASSLV